MTRRASADLPARRAPGPLSLQELVQGGPRRFLAPFVEILDGGSRDSKALQDGGHWRLVVEIEGGLSGPGRRQGHHAADSTRNGVKRPVHARTVADCLGRE